MTWATTRLDALVAGRADPPPVVRTLKLGLLDAWEPGLVRKVWRPDPDVLQADGTMFGSYLSALADQVLAFAAMTVVPADQAFRTINLSVQFLKLARGEPIDIEARVVAQSRSLITVDASFKRLDGELLCRATAQQMLTPVAG